MRTSIRVLLAIFLAAGLFAGGAVHLQSTATAGTPQAALRTAARVEPSRLMDDVQALSSGDLRGRLTGSEGNKRAQAIIVERFRRLGIEPLGKSYEQKFSFKSQGDRRARTTGAAAYPDATNLVAIIRGAVERDRFILVGAHYDHLGAPGGQIFHGADDNASGVAAMLAAAEWFTKHSPARSIIFVAFDAEEQGLRGARHFVEHPPLDLKKIALVINMDMVSRGDANTLYVAGTHHSPRLKDPVAALAAGRSIKIAFGHDRPGTGRDDWTDASDHGAFHERGLPFLYFGVEDHPDYHKPTDTADRIPRDFYVAATEFIIDVIARFASGDE